MNGLAKSQIVGEQKKMLEKLRVDMEAEVQRRTLEVKAHIEDSNAKNVAQVLGKVDAAVHFEAEPIKAEAKVMISEAVSKQQARMEAEEADHVAKIVSGMEDKFAADREFLRGELDRRRVVQLKQIEDATVRQQENLQAAVKRTNSALSSDLAFFRAQVLKAVKDVHRRHKDGIAKIHYQHKAHLMSYDMERGEPSTPRHAPTEKAAGRAGAGAKEEVHLDEAIMVVDPAVRAAKVSKAGAKVEAIRKQMEAKEKAEAVATEKASARAVQMPVGEAKVEATKALASAAEVAKVAKQSGSTLLPANPLAEPKVIV